MESWAASVATLCYACLAQQVAKTRPVDAAACNNAIEGADAASATALGCAYHLTSESQALEYRLGRWTIGCVQLRGIEIGEANLDPLIWVGRLPHAKTVAVAHVSDDAGELDSGPRREKAFARICVGWRGVAERRDCGGQHEKSNAHAAFFSAPLLFFLISNARTNLSHFAMAARFSGI